jgi:hypothetical protein
VRNKQSGQPSQQQPNKPGSAAALLLKIGPRASVYKVEHNMTVVPILSDAWTEAAQKEDHEA